MERFFKPARDRFKYRGCFSYFTESIINLMNLLVNDKGKDIIYYHELFNIPGYSTLNIFDVCFKQNLNDFTLNKSLYQNIELIKNNLSLNVYDDTTFTNEIRLFSEDIIKKYFIFNDPILELFNKRFSKIDFNNIIGVHRRATDIGIHNPIVPINAIFSEIDNSIYGKIFLMCDNHSDMVQFKSRYGEKILTFDTLTSQNEKLPFFKYNSDNSKVEKHIIELVFGAFALGKTKKLICTKSNISTFSIFSNAKLEYKLLKL